MTAPTNQGRSVESVMARAIQARRTGRWPAWTWHTIKPGQVSTRGWASEFTRAAENGVFCVMVRDVPTAWGVVRHAMISTPGGRMEPTWSERQRIKNELLGRQRVAVEVFPGMSDLIDEAEAYHLWLLPEGFTLPFGLHAAAQNLGQSSPVPDYGAEAPAAANENRGGEDCIINDPRNPI